MREMLVAARLILHLVVAVPATQPELPTENWMVPGRGRCSADSPNWMKSQGRKPTFSYGKAKGFLWIFLPIHWTDASIWPTTMASQPTKSASKARIWTPNIGIQTATEVRTTDIGMKFEQTGIPGIPKTRMLGWGPLKLTHLSGCCWHIPQCRKCQKRQARQQRRCYFVGPFSRRVQ